MKCRASLTRFFDVNRRREEVVVVEGIFFLCLVLSDMIQYVREGGSQMVVVDADL